MESDMKKALAFVPATLWMGVIFLMSAMPGDVSGAQSGTIAELVRMAVSFVLGERVAAALSPDLVNLLVRKAAHMTEYAILFLLEYRALKTCGARRPGAAALLICAGYAATDEWHQSFVADRGPSPIDVCIDTLGAGLAWGIASAVRAVRGRRKKQNGSIFREHNR